MAPQPVKIRGLFFAAFQIGLFSFGGGLTAWMHREFVIKRGWMDEPSFHVDQAIARILPGTNVSNFMVIGGYRMGGLLGSVVGVLGVLLGPFFVVIGAAMIYDRLSGPLLSNLLAGAGAAALGFIVPLLVRGIRLIGRTWNGLAVIVAVAIGVGLLGAPMAAFIALALPCSIGLVLWRRKHDAR